MLRPLSAAVVWAPGRPEWLSPDPLAESMKASQKLHAGRSKTTPRERGYGELWRRDARASILCSSAAALGSTSWFLRPAMILDACGCLLSPKEPDFMIFLRLTGSPLTHGIAESQPNPFTTEDTKEKTGREGKPYRRWCRTFTTS